MSIDVAVLGASGLVGQELIRRLCGHPTLRLREVVASERSAGKRLADVAGSDAQSLSETVTDLRLLSPEDPLQASVLLSALPRAAALRLEPLYAAQGHLVCSNASAFRNEARVPLLIPEINPESLALLERQSWRATGGGIVTNPNCMVCGLAMALAPLQRRFGIESTTMVTLQAISGAGRGGLAAWQSHANVVPHIEGEAEKIPVELHKILEADFPVSVAVNRVPVLDGHLASVFVRLRGNPAIAEINEALRGFGGDSSELPSSPPSPLRLVDARDRPQPRLDLNAGDGMTVSVGALRPDPHYDVGFSLLVHNLVRGAAGACLLNAELLVASGRVAGPALVGVG